jgi:hypothetical protein
LLGLAGLEVSNTLLKVGLAVLGLELLAHGESHGAKERGKKRLALHI